MKMGIVLSKAILKIKIKIVAELKYSSNFAAHFEKTKWFKVL
jgi:hypothetical protein